MQENLEMSTKPWSSSELPPQQSDFWSVLLPIHQHYFIKTETWETAAGKAISKEYCAVTAHAYENKVQTCQNVTENQRVEESDYRVTVI